MAAELTLGATWVNTNAPDSAQKYQVAQDTIEVQNVHINAFGSDLGYQAAAGDTDWAGYNWSWMDTRVQRMRDGQRPGGKLALTLYLPPQWMLGVAAGQWPADLYDRPLLPEYRGEFATLCAYIAQRYPDVTHFQVWNEFKGYWHPTENRWDYAAYTAMYNAVYAAVKEARPDAQIGGPYPAIRAWASPEYDGWGTVNTQAVYDLGGVSSSVTGAGYYIDARVLDAMNYWRINAAGWDFVAFDMGLNMNQDGVEGTAVYLDTIDRFPKVLAWVAERFPGDPVWLSEYYYGGGLANFNLLASELRGSVAAGEPSEIVALLWHETVNVADILFDAEGARTAIGDAHAAHLEGKAAVSMVRELSGPDAVLSAPNTAALQMSTAFTVAFWIKYGARNAAWNGYFSKGNSLYVADRGDAAEGVVSLDLTGTPLTLAAPDRLPVGVWKYVVARWASGQPARIDVFNLDGTVFSTAQSAAHTGTLPANTTALRVGANYWAGSSISGSYARVFYHNQSLTDQQVETLRQGTLPVNPSGGYWPLDGDGATEPNARVGGGPSLTATSAAPVNDPSFAPPGAVAPLPLSGTSAAVSGASGAITVPGGSPGRPYFQAADWYWDPIPPSPVLHDKTATWSGYLAAGQHPANLDEYANAIVYFAEIDGSTPRYSVSASMAPGWGPNPFAGYQIPVPVAARSRVVPFDGENDAWLIVADPSTNKVFHLWQAKWTGTTWTASWGGVSDIEGDARDDITGSGLSNFGGTIRLAALQEAAANNTGLGHALQFSSDAAAGSLESEFVYPATKTDGHMWTQVVADPIWEGTRVQLDPSIDVDAIVGITAAEKVIAKTLQTHGAYLIDNGGARAALMFERQANGAITGYSALGLGWDYYELGKVPWGQMRVLKHWHGGATLGQGASVVPVAGTSAAVSGASGTVTARKRLAGTAQAVSGASGRVAARRSLAGTSAATSGTTGTVTLARPQLPEQITPGATTGHLSHHAALHRQHGGALPTTPAEGGTGHLSHHTTLKAWYDAGNETPLPAVADAVTHAEAHRVLHAWRNGGAP